MKVLVMGATGGSGRAAVQALRDAGHAVTVMTRSGNAFTGQPVRELRGDALDAQDVRAAVRGQDAVVVALGISENALRVRLFGPARTPANVRSAGTARVIDAMRAEGVRRLVVQSSFGVGSSRDKLPLASRLLFALLLKPQIADTEVQEAQVRASGLDWTSVQPVNLTDDAVADPPFIATDDRVRRMRVARVQVGRLLAQLLDSPEHVGQVVAVSG